MGVASTYLSAVAAGALTAGVAASNVVVAPDTTNDAPAVSGVGLSAITIPIVDIDQTVGPLTFSRLLALTLGDAPTLFGLDSSAGSIWDFPRLATNFTNISSGKQTLSAIRTPGESTKFEFVSQGPVDSSWSLLGLAQGATDIEQSRALNFTAFTGGSEGIGAGLGGTLADATVKRSVSVLDSGFTSASTRKVGDFAGQLSLMPFDGFEAVGGGTLVDTGGNTNFKLGSLQVGGGGQGALSGGAGLCLGSAQGTDGCAPNTLAFASVAAPIKFDVHTGAAMTDVFSVDLPNNLAVAVGDRHLSVTGDIGGTVKIGSVELGRIRHVDIQIPGGSSMLSASSTQQSVTNSFLAAPRKLGSDNGSSSTGRHAARDAVNSAVAGVKTAVDNAVHSKPRHAKPDTAN